MEAPETVLLLPPTPSSPKIVNYTLGGIAEITATKKYLKDTEMMVSIMFLLNLTVRSPQNLYGL